MPTWWMRVPEWECAKNGDPYFTDLVRMDDVLDDHRYHADDMGLDAATAAAVIAFVEDQQLHYELAALHGWWAL